MHKCICIGVTGTPASGKSTFARRLAYALDGRLIEINEVLEKAHAYSTEKGSEEKIANILKLKKAIKKELAASASGICILVGHLLPDLGMHCNAVFVTRANIAVRKKRMEKRGYKKQKIAENLAAEAIDYCGVNSKKASKNIYEIETAAEKRAAIAGAKELVKTGRPEKLAFLKMQKDKMKEFERFISNNRDFGL